MRLSTAQIEAIKATEQGQDLVERYVSADGEVADENVDALLDAMELDEDEMLSVAGGECGYEAPGDGGCTGSYFQEACTDTVEKGSDCHRGDYCSFSSNKYSRPGCSGLWYDDEDHRDRKHI